MIKYTEQHNFQEIINKEGYVVVDFYAEWCGPCQMLLPQLETLSNTRYQSTPIYKINIDEFRALAIDSQIRSVPTVIVYKDGKEFKRASGVEQALDLLESVLG